MSKTGLESRAMLVNLTIRQWSAHKRDNRVTGEVAQRENAERGAGNYNKKLLTKDALLFLQSVAGAARKDHYERTLPWADEGARILSASAYFEYARIMRQHRLDFDRVANEFAGKYPDYIKLAQRQLGNMYNPADYPKVAEIRSKFAIETSVMPLPAAADFRVDLPEHELAQVRLDIEQQVRDSMARGQQDVYRRIHEVMSHMVEKLNGYVPATDDKRPQGIFRDTLVTNVKHLAELIPSLNVTGDKSLTELCAQMKLVTDVEPDVLRTSDTARSKTAKSAQQILDAVSEYMA